MNWYAIRTQPGAQAQYRERWIVPSASALAGHLRGRGYSVASALTPHQTRIEVALRQAGFVYYMPAEFVAVRNRDKRGHYDLRRFPLLPGYVFVSEMEDRDWPKLRDVVGVKEPVRRDGKPFPISGMDIHLLRMYEANSRAEAEAKAIYFARLEEQRARKAKKAAIRSVKQKLFPGRSVKLIWGNKVGREATVQAWQDQDQVRVLLRDLEDAAETITVPYEFLKAC